jgi:hypothetical protein
MKSAEHGWIANADGDGDGDGSVASHCSDSAERADFTLPLGGCSAVQCSYGSRSPTRLILLSVTTDTDTGREGGGGGEGDGPLPPLRSEPPDRIIGGVGEPLRSASIGSREADGGEGSDSVRRCSAPAAANALATTADVGLPLGPAGAGVPATRATGAAATAAAGEATATVSERRCWARCCMERDTRGGVVIIGDFVTVAEGSSDTPTANTLRLLILCVILACGGSRERGDGPAEPPATDNRQPTTDNRQQVGWIHAEEGELNARKGGPCSTAPLPVPVMPMLARPAP